MEFDLVVWAIFGSLAALGAWVAYKWVKKRKDAVIAAAKGDLKVPSE
jgi:hypothetical protein